jgi:hypothetical protein
VLALAAAGVVRARAEPAGTAVRGFRTDDVTCAVSLSHRAGLYCAARAIGGHRYDGRGIVRLTADGRIGFPAAGNDLLLAIDGDLPRSPRPRLRAGDAWAAGGYRCVCGRSTLRCFRAHHGFVIGSAHLVRF